MINETITVTVNGKSMTANAGGFLSELLQGEMPCGGNGICGKCKVIAHGALSGLTDAERSLLSREEIRQGWRLSCRTRAMGDCTVETIPEENQVQIFNRGDFHPSAIHPTFSRFGAAVDVGTTTLAARLYDPHGKLLAAASCLNPQKEWGADVISRVDAAMNGKSAALAGAIRGALNELLADLASSAGIDALQIDGAVITGNTVMLSLLTGESTEPFSHAPFDVRRLFGEMLTAKDLELTVLFPDTKIYLPPCISAFVGADAACAILATELTENNGPVLLADIGTNGEMALWNQGKLTVCSTAAGPAFEGVGISMGMRGAAGAIDKVTLSGDEWNVHVIGELPPIGICGSGLVDAAACMLETSVLDESGYLDDDPFVVRSPVELTQKDIRMLQLAKSAIRAGLLTLLSNERLTPEDVTGLLIAGGFGSCLNPVSAAGIGLLPRELARKTKAVGNAALDGASLLLLNRQAITKIARISENASVLELSVNPTFADLFMSGLSFDC